MSEPTVALERSPTNDCPTGDDGRPPVETPSIADANVAAVAPGEAIRTPLPGREVRHG